MNDKLLCEITHKNADKMKIIIKVDLRKQIETYRNVLIGLGLYNVGLIR